MDDNFVNLIARWKEDAKVWEQEGKNPILFWSGRLAMASTDVIHSSALGVSTHILFLSKILDIYNEVVIERLDK